MKLTHHERQLARRDRKQAKLAQRRRRECTGYDPSRPDAPPKKRYKSEAEARMDKRMTFIMDPSRGPVNVFPCAACGGYHIGHPSRNIAQPKRNGEPNETRF